MCFSYNIKILRLRLPSISLGKEIDFFYMAYSAGALFDSTSASMIPLFNRQI